MSPDYHPLDFTFPGFYAITEGRTFPPEGPFDSEAEATRGSDYVLFWDGRALHEGAAVRRIAVEPVAEAWADHLAARDQAVDYIRDRITKGESL